MSKPKPCRVCGCHAMVYVAKYKDLSKKVYLIACSNVFCKSMPNCATGIYENKKDAVQEWNRRNE